MKMFKKLMAVALTAVMAVSMLTGCALSDKVTSEALEKALNKEQVQGTVDIDYKYDNDLNNENTQTDYKYSSANYESTGKKIWQNELDEGKKIVATTLDTLKTYKNGETNYVYVVVKVPEDAKKVASWSASTAGTVHKELLNKVKTSGNGTKKNVDIDVYFDDYKAEGAEKSTHYAIVIAKAAV